MAFGGRNVVRSNAWSQSSAGSSGMPQKTIEQYEHIWSLQQDRWNYRHFDTWRHRFRPRSLRPSSLEEQQVRFDFFFFFCFLN
jgi:hypothetical protein